MKEYWEHTLELSSCDLRLKAEPHSITVAQRVRVKRTFWVKFEHDARKMRIFSPSVPCKYSFSFEEEKYFLRNSRGFYPYLYLTS